MATGVALWRRLRALTAANAELSRINRQLLLAQDEERRRIARELHDESGQWLTSLIAGLGALERQLEQDSPAQQRARGLRQVSERTLEELGRLARGLYPSSLDRLGLRAAVEHLVGEYGKHHDIAVDAHIRGLDLGARLDAEVERALYRGVQEMLTNVSKHARAKSVCVLLDRGIRHVRLTVDDDGCGFSASPQGSGLGLAGLRERAQHLGGTLHIESEPGRGSTLALELPLRGEP